MESKVMAIVNGVEILESDVDRFIELMGDRALPYKNPEGKMVAKNIEWHKANGTYTASYIIGAMIVTIGLLTLAGIWSPTLGLLGGLLTFGMSIVTLSFLIFTPETWVPNLGGDLPTPNYGFPYLSAAGRLIIKDIIMMAGGLVAAAECANRYLKYKTSV